jgi:hypothetical protein
LVLVLEWVGVYPPQGYQIRSSSMPSKALVVTEQGNCGSKRGKEKKKGSGDQPFAG